MKILPYTNSFTKIAEPIQTALNRVYSVFKNVLILILPNNLLSAYFLIFFNFQSASMSLKVGENVNNLPLTFSL